MKQIQTLLVTSSKFERTKTNLEVFVDEEGIYQCGGRLHKANLSFECIHPPTKPKDHHMVELIVKDSHNKVYHNVLHSFGKDCRSIKQPTTNLPWRRRYQRATHTNPSIL